LILRQSLTGLSMALLAPSALTNPLSQPCQLPKTSSTSRAAEGLPAPVNARRARGKAATVLCLRDSRDKAGAAANAASICNGPSERIVQHADGSAVPIAYSDKTVPWRSVRRSK